MDLKKYEEHIAILKELKHDKSFEDVRKPYKEDFDAIYNDAKEKGITLSSAKEYLDSLSKEQLSTLQNYTRLANEINVDTLSDEGAYNLLLEHYEKYDFDNDGFIEDGIGKTSPIIPSHFSNAEKKALVATLNSLGPKNMLMMATLLMPPFKFVNGEISLDSQSMKFSDIQKRVEIILDPKNKDNATQAFIETTKVFWRELMKNYSSISQKEISYGITNS